MAETLRMGDRHAGTSGSTIIGRLDEAVNRAVREGDIVGTVVEVAIDGAIVYRRAAGLIDREAGTPMRDDAVFRYASLTKLIICTAALTLIERGELELDDPVTRYLPEFTPTLSDGSRPSITIRHLMTHTSGLSYGFLEPESDSPYRRAGVSDGLDEPGRSTAENVARLLTVPLLFTPGSQFHHSVSMDILGEVMARASGRSLQELVRERVTDPLGMVDTVFSTHPSDRLARPYGDGDPAPVRMGERHLLRSAVGTVVFAPGRIFDATSFPSGGAGMAGTADDFLTLLECLRRGGGPILKGETIHLLTRVATGELVVDLLGPGWRFGLGVAILDNPTAAGTPQSPGTWHWSGAYGHSWFVDPARRTTVVALTNTALAGMVGAYPESIRDAVYGAG